MGYMTFGNTWWGNQWLKALNNMDYSNRLPRGQRYARNGSVKQIEIDANKIKAKVAGSRPSPYRVSMELEVFSESQKKKIEALIKTNPYYLAKFESRELPEELYDETKNFPVPLFPGSWKKMKMRCSCPDWAVPCKHLAAVVYLIANEIDKNPFILFELHKFDILKLFEAAGKTEEEEIPALESFRETQAPEYNTTPPEESPDFTVIPNLMIPTVKLLTEKPLFYPKGDFKKILLGHYQNMAKAITKHIKNLELKEEDPEILYEKAEIVIGKKEFQFKGFLKTKAEILSFDSKDPGKLVDYLQGLQLGNLPFYPPMLSFLVMVHSFVLMLIQKSAYIPDLFSPAKEQYCIRWIPSIFNGETGEVFERLADALPSGFIKYEKTLLQKKEQLLFLISFFIQHYQELFDPVKKEGYGEMVSLFFRGGIYNAKGFEKQENGRTIHLWLSRFFIRPKTRYPVIKISESEKEERLFFDLLIRGARKDLMPLAEYLKADDPEKFPVLKDLSLLSTYLPAVNKLLSTGKEVAVSSDAFAKIWFEALPVLRTLNIETILPKALKEIFIPALTLSVKKQASGKPGNIINYLSLKELLAFNWTVAIGDKYISEDEFFALAGKYTGIIKFQDRYIYLDQKEIEKISKKLKKEPSFNSLELLKILLEKQYQDVSVETGTGLKNILENLFTPADVTVPATLNARLREYQEAGYRWLYHNTKIGIGSLIADDMGLGKTIQIITLLLKLKEETKKKTSLIIVPATLLTNWKREIEKFAPSLKAAIYHGTGRKEEEGADVIITTYSLVRLDHAYFSKKKWFCLILDEAQNIKNPTSSQAKAIKTLKGDIKIAMTGTPVENRLMDYWSIFDFTMKRLLGNQKNFKENYAVPIEKFQDRKKLSFFRSITGPFVLRRLKTDRSIISDLPDKLELNRYVKMTEEQTALYQGLIDNIDSILEESEGIARKGMIFKLIIGLKQICNHPSLYLKKKEAEAALSGKALLLMDLIEKRLDCHEKIIIFSQFREMGHLLEQMISKQFGFNPLFLHGGLQRKKRDAIVDSFQNDRECPVIILSLKAGGTGLNLTAANNVVHYDLWWNPAVENQATDRAFRIGQKKNVSVYRFITGNSFEEKINDMLMSKKELADLTVNVGEKWITELSNGELKKLLKLEV